VNTRNYGYEIWPQKTSNVTGCHRGPKRKLRAGYRAAPRHITIYRHRNPSRDVTEDDCDDRRVWYRALSLRYAHAMRVFAVRASFSSLDHLLAKFCFCHTPYTAELYSPRRKIAYTQSLTQSLTHPAYLMPREPKLSLRNYRYYFIVCCDNLYMLKHTSMKCSWSGL